LTPLRIPFIKLPSSQPHLAREHLRQFAKVLSSSRFILGEQVSRFEAEFAAFCGAPYSVSVANGTEALQIALRLSGVRPGLDQEVITTPWTASFTVHAIVAAGGRTVFADVDPETLLLDPAATRRQLSSRTAAIVPVHIYGQCCDMSAFGVLAKRSGCALVQDAAQAHGSAFRERPLTEFSDWATYSFYPTKNLGCFGDGGALVTRNRALAEQARQFRDGGRRKDHTSHSEGINSRLDELQAAVLRTHLRRLKEWNGRRQRLAARYDRLLAERAARWVKTLPQAKNSRSSHHLYVIRTRRRDELRAFLLRRGIETMVHYDRPLHLHPAFRRLGYHRGDFPVAERAAREVCSLPLHPFLSDRDVDRITAEIARFFARP
jgi:dTDP-3-amino-3,4,6-trideoxy-alpha-D-glucose transaminase